MCELILFMLYMSFNEVVKFVNMTAQLFPVTGACVIYVFSV